ncbi:hypothetical protein D623_10015949 [Myotis brandtii]|uniref:Uncharacterized protein n=1 Tax=Myotis brandtii TaxID=109478 RepID=S7PTQ2_MYOBR|nr:hypothetical protein D623_10015949 [Myotis brandtii]
MHIVDVASKSRVAASALSECEKGGRGPQCSAELGSLRPQGRDGECLSGILRPVFCKFPLGMELI